MKRFLKSIRIKFFILFILLTPNLSWSKTVGLVHSVKGNVFVVRNGAAEVVSPGYVLEDFMEVVTEIGGQITFSDHYDHKFHLSGSGHVRLMQRLLDLKSGYLWIQSYTDNVDSIVQTANSRITYNGGESIISFDGKNGKTQLLVLDGIYKLGNLLQDHLSIDVSSGQFSFVSEDFNNGAPRTSTNIGENSFKKILALFSGVKPLNEGQQFMKRSNSYGSGPKRGVASVGNLKVKKNDRDKDQLGRFLYREKADKVVSRKFNLDKFYAPEVKEFEKLKKKRRSRPKVLKKIYVPIRIFGLSNLRKLNSFKSKPKKRSPASIKSNPKLNKNISKKNTPFENSLVNQYKKQLRHSKEVNQLINDLKNIDQDYKKEY